MHVRSGPSRPRPTVALLLAIALVSLATGSGSPASALPSWPSAAAANAAIGKGVEIISPCCGWDPIGGNITARADAVRAKGFTGVRFAVKFSPGQNPNPPYDMDPVYLDKIRAEVEVLLAHRLTVVLHNNEGLEGDYPSGDRLVARWTQIAERFRDLPPSVYFEVANEPNWGGPDSGPQIPTTPDEWNALVARVIPVIRATNPERTIVVTSAYWSFPQAIPELKLPTDDGHLIATFHNYFPFEFTYQGSYLAGSDAWIGTTWTRTPDQVAAMKQTMNAAVCWSRRTGVPLFNGEFSSYKASYYTDRDPMLWTKTMVQLLQAEGISWTYFSLNGFPDPDTGKFVLDLLWYEQGGIWNQPVLDAFDQALAQPVQPWATCANQTPPTTPVPTSGPPPNPAATDPTTATPVAAVPRFTG